MQEFKYSLDKSSKKYICPNCNKKTFVFYVDTEKGKYLPTNYGRCDREQNCGYHKAPPKGNKAYLIDFITLKRISDKATRIVDLNGLISIVPNSQILSINKNSCWITEWHLKTSTLNYINNQSKFFVSDEVAFFNVQKTIQEQPKKKGSFHSSELQDNLINQYNNQKFDDNLTTFLFNNFSFDEVQRVTQDYYLTGSNYYWKNETIFWQIDEKERIHAGKIMLYDEVLGKRIKKPYNHINWLHNALKEPEFNLKQCLFGLHLVNEDYSKEIAIVESEKTAIIMSIYLPEFIWVATGSKSNFKFELLKPLKNRKCIAFPDKGEFYNWNKKAKELQAKGFKIAVSNILENTTFENGFDLADYYFEMHEM